MELLEVLKLFEVVQTSILFKKISIYFSLRYLMEINFIPFIQISFLKCGGIVCGSRTFYEPMERKGRWCRLTTSWTHRQLGIFK